MAERKKARSDIPHEELIHCMYQMLDAICWLHRHNSFVDDLRTMYIGRRADKCNWMLLDRLFDPTPAHVSQFSNYVNKRDLYMSPDLWANVFKGKKVRKEGVKHDAKKSDLFALGMCILEAGVLSSLQDVYNTKDGTINCESLDKHIHHFNEKYGCVNGLLCDILQHCLIIDECQRPTCCELLHDITPYNEVCHYLSSHCETVVETIIHHDIHESPVHTEVHVERARPHHETIVEHHESPARHKYEGHVASHVIHGDTKHHTEVIRNEPKVITEHGECVITHSQHKLKPEVHVEKLEPRHERSQMEAREPVHCEPIHYHVEKTVEHHPVVIFFFQIPLGAQTQHSSSPRRTCRPQRT
jgi:serine/threonine protein kinase